MLYKMEILKNNSENPVHEKKKEKQIKLDRRNDPLQQGRECLERCDLDFSTFQEQDTKDAELRAKTKKKLDTLKEKTTFWISEIPDIDSVLYPNNTDLFPDENDSKQFQEVVDDLDYVEEV